VTQIGQPTVACTVGAAGRIRKPGRSGRFGHRRFGHCPRTDAGSAAGRLERDRGSCPAAYLPRVEPKVFPRERAGF